MYHESYEEYIRSILGYPNYGNAMFENSYQYMPDNFRNTEKNSELEACYPEIYKIVYPMIKKACVSNIKALNNSKAIKIKKSRIAVMTEEDKIKVVSVTAIPNKANKLVSTNIFDNLALEKVELMAIDETGIPVENRETSISYMNYVLLAKFR